MPRWIDTLLISLYRLIRGGPAAGFILLLGTRGRKTGKERITALRYIRDGTTYVVIGSNYGRPNTPAWYLNLQADPNVWVQVGGRRLQAQARTVPLQERQRLWEALVKTEPRYETYLERTTRIFPIVRLTPR